MSRQATRDSVSVDEAVQAVKTHGVEKERYPVLFPSGSTMLNLACSGTTRGWAAPGMIVNLPGKSNAGKSILAMSSMAATFYRFGDEFDYYDDDIECARNFDIAGLFGERFAAALKRPRYKYELPIKNKNGKVVKIVPVATCERWYKNVMAALDSGKPCVYNTDSLDALKSAVAVRRMMSLEDDDVEEAEASYATEKARFLSEYLPKLQTAFAASQSLLLLISQVRDSFQQGAFVKKDTRSGGRAMKFYASVEVWLAVIEKLGKDPKRPVGVLTRATVERSRITGKWRQAEFPILYAYGVDDTSSMLEFLKSVGKVKFTSGGPVFKADIPGVTDLGLPRIEWVSAIEKDKEANKALRKYVAKVWHNLEDKARDEWLGDRPPKFS